MKTDQLASSTEIDLIHDAMVECRLLPDDIKRDEHGRYLVCCPQLNREDTWEYLGDSYALHILRGIAEEWLKEQGAWNWLSPGNDFDVEYQLITFEPLKETEYMPLPDALRYAKIRKGQ